MPNYTTGELAKRCGVTVRTVQHYDNKGVLHPSALSEGGRRLYSDEDLQKMQTICLLRNLGLSLDTIKKIFDEPNGKEVITLILTEQLKTLEAEIDERQAQTKQINAILRGVEETPDFSLENLTDIADRMKQNKQKNPLRAVYGWMLAIGILLDLAQIGMVLLWIFTGVWIPFAVGMPLVVLSAFLLVFGLYYPKAAYICPECHQKFQPKKAPWFFAKHTPHTRKLTCPHCSKKSYCVETTADPSVK